MIRRYRTAIRDSVLLTAWLILAVPSPLLHAAPLPGQIVANPANPTWLTREDGTPFFLCGPGDPEEFLYLGTRNPDGTRDGEQADLIDKVIGTGANSIYLEAFRTGGDGGPDHNPFEGSNTSNLLDQDILDQWETWFTEMDDNGIVIYFVFYDDAIDIANEIGWPLDNNDNLHPQEQYFIDTLVDEFEHHENLVWVVSEEAQEMGSDYVEHTKAIAEAIRAADDHDHVIGVHKLTGIDFSEFADDPNIDQFLIQDNSSPNAIELHDDMVAAWNLAAGRYNLNMSEARNHGFGATGRRKNWAIAMGGAYVMGFRWHIWDTSIEDLEQCGYLAGFMESTRFYDMAPHDELAHQGSDYVLADPDTAYIAYRWNLPADIGLKNMTAGDYDFTWIDPVSGATVEQFGVAVAAGDQTWPTPTGMNTEVAVYIRVVDTLPPAIGNVATNPAGPVVTADTITISGTASDADQGDNGIAQVTIDGVPANGGSASSAGTANWSLDVTLAPGPNALTVVATDGSNSANQSMVVVNVTYQPIPDGDLDGMPDAWEAANGTDPLVDDAADDDDFDGIPNIDEYNAGTDPQSGASAPEGAGGVNYVLFRDHFDDSMYGDRWYLGATPGAGYALNEAGTELAASVAVPVAGCDVLRVDSLATAAGSSAILRTVFDAGAEATTTLGWMGETDRDNRVEVVFDSDTAPHALLRSVHGGVVTDAPLVTITAPLTGVPVEVAIAKNGSTFDVFIDQVNHGGATNAGLDPLDLQPYVEVASCSGDTGAATADVDFVEMLIDRDADGRADTHEDINADGIVDAGETDPLNADSDTDTVADGFDNCPLISNLDQTDTDGDLLGDACDDDDDGDGVPDSQDQYPLDPAQSGIIGDVDGGGIVDLADLLLLQQALSGRLTLTTQQQYRADVYPVGVGDDMLDVSDLAVLQEMLSTP